MFSRSPHVNETFVALRFCWIRKIVRFTSIVQQRSLPLIYSSFFISPLSFPSVRISSPPNSLTSSSSYTSVFSTSSTSLADILTRCWAVSARDMATVVRQLAATMIDWEAGSLSNPFAATATDSAVLISESALSVRDLSVARGSAGFLARDSSALSSASSRSYCLMKFHLSLPSGYVMGCYICLFNSKFKVECIITHLKWFHLPRETVYQGVTPFSIRYSTNDFHGWSNLDQ